MLACLPPSSRVSRVSVSSRLSLVSSRLALCAPHRTTSQPSTVQCSASILPFWPSTAAPHIPPVSSLLVVSSRHQTPRICRAVQQSSSPAAVARCLSPACLHSSAHLHCDLHNTYIIAAIHHIAPAKPPLPRSCRRYLSSRAPVPSTPPAACRPRPQYERAHAHLLPPLPLLHRHQHSRPLPLRSFSHTHARAECAGIDTSRPICATATFLNPHHSLGHLPTCDRKAEATAAARCASRWRSKQTTGAMSYTFAPAPAKTSQLSTTLPIHQTPRRTPAVHTRSMSYTRMYARCSIQIRADSTKVSQD